MIKYNMGWNKNDCHKEYAKPEDDYIGIEDIAGQYVDPGKSGCRALSIPKILNGKAYHPPMHNQLL